MLKRCDFLGGGRGEGANWLLAVGGLSKGVRLPDLALNASLQAESHGLGACWLAGG